MIPATSRSDMAMQFEARKVALKQDKTGYILTLSLHPDEIPAELLRDFVGARYACAVVRIEDDESPTQYSNRVSIAGMLCRDAGFQRYVAELMEKPFATEAQAAQYVCHFCGIESRTELNGNMDAQVHFDAMRQQFKQWSEDGDQNDPF
jgi:hypothetical protein